jgi:hypothetical protein
MLALRVPRALPVEGFLESFLRTESLLSASGYFPSFWLALSSCLQVVERELIAGGVVGFHFFALLLPSNYDIAGITASVDDGTKVARGGVLEVTAPLVVHLDGAVPALGALRIDEPAALLLGVICVFHLNVGWGFTIHYCVHIFVEWVKEMDSL